jgi:hypothetical protein
MVERPGFKRLLRVLEPRYEVPAKLSKFGIKLNKLQSRKNIGIIGIFSPVSVFVFFQIPQQPNSYFKD